jgi:hypothetical protein
LQGIDPSSIDPRDVLREIVADRSSPASARVSACRALLNDEAERRVIEANSHLWPAATPSKSYKDEQ